MADAAAPGLNELERVLASAGIAWSAPAAHGLLTGRIVADASTSRDGLLEALGETDPGPAYDAMALQQVLEGCRLGLLRSLHGEECAFEPLLPPDVETLKERTLALSAWVDGFLGGLGQSRRLGERSPSGQATEILRDFAEIARVDHDPEETEENELAFSELVEYVRVGVMLLADELMPIRADAAGAPLQ